MQHLDTFREKLQNKISCNFDESRNIIRFDDGTEIPGDLQLTMIKPTWLKQQRDGDTKIYTFSSLWLLIEAITKPLNVAAYVQAARRLHITQFPFLEARNVYACLTGETDECDLLHFTIQPQTQQILKPTKKYKVEQWTVNDLLGVQQGALLPNTSFTLHNSPLNNNDYISMMKSIYTELSTSYVDVINPNDKSTPLNKRKSMKPEQGYDPSTLDSLVRVPENPIIIVPSGQTLSFSFKNLGDLLAHGTYIKSTEPDTSFDIKVGIPSTTLSATDLQSFYCFKKLTKNSILEPGTKATFELCSDPAVLTPDQWNRVIGVIVTGKAYQLESFTPFLNQKDRTVDTPLLFEQLAGIYLYFDGEKLPPTINQWNVSTHKFAVSKRFQDQVVMSEVWDRLIQFARKKQRSNPNLFF